MPKSTADPGYAARLDGLERRRLARWFDVQAPYRRNIRRLEPGFVLDVGCGLGRNLLHLEGNGVGVDHNPDAVEACRARGLEVFAPDEFHQTEHARSERFDSLLLAHVVEHLTEDDGRALVAEYLPFVKRDGRVILICPQQAGFRSDDTHVTYYDRGRLVRFAEESGLEPESTISFPFPTVAGLVFPYNETVLVARRLTA